MLEKWIQGRRSQPRNHVLLRRQVALAIGQDRRRQMRPSLLGMARSEVYVHYDPIPRNKVNNKRITDRDNVPFP
jgi:hypothetical protein